MRNQTFIAASAVAAMSFLLSSVAQAHSGSRIYLAAPGGTITTYQGTPDNENATSFAASRVFATDLPQFLSTNLYFTEFPGFQVATSIGGVTAATSFTFSIAGPLQFFDYNNPAPGVGTYRTVQDKFSPGTVPQMGLSIESDLVTTGAGPVTGFSFLNFTGPGDHGHITYTLFGNGTSAGGGPDGVYALPLTVSGGSLTDSPTFYLLLGKNVDVGTAHMDAAIAAANTQLIPELASISLVAMLGIGLLGRRRRRRTLQGADSAF